MEYAILAIVSLEKTKQNKRGEIMESLEDAATFIVDQLDSVSELNVNQFMELCGGNAKLATLVLEKIDVTYGYGIVLRSGTDENSEFRMMEPTLSITEDKAIWTGENGNQGSSMKEIRLEIPKESWDALTILFY